MGVFSKNDTIDIHGGGVATVLDDGPLGSGGQGEVYRVMYNGETYALKWYTEESILRNVPFKDNLDNNIQKGIDHPELVRDSDFLWPIRRTEEIDGSYGYLMALKPLGFSDFSDILRTYSLENDSKGNTVRKEVRFTDLSTMVRSALRIVESFRMLHRLGLSYQDLNDGGIFINTVSGDVRICDCDNVAPFGNNYGISGKPGFMAPEVVTHESPPSTNTDKFSLAVMLFKLFIRSDPLEGARVVKSTVLTGANELKHYGTDPLFIFDPNDDSNRPVRGVHGNAISLWPLYPEYIRDAFTKVFTLGLKDPDERLAENEWFNLLLRLLSDIVKCDSCNHPKRFIQDHETSEYKCPKCGTCRPVYTIHNSRRSYRAVMNANTQLYPFQTVRGSEIYNTVSAKMMESSKSPGVFGLKNNDNTDWTVTMSDGTVKTIPVGKAAVFVDGMKFCFENNVTMEKVNQ